MSSPIIEDETTLLIVPCAAAIHQQLYLVIDLLNEQARVLKRLDGKRLRTTNDERRRLATLAKKLGRQVLEAQELIVTVDTFRRWHRQLIAATYSENRTGRPRLDTKTEALIVQMSNDNPTWGEDSIQDRLADLGITVSDRTIANVLMPHGIPPAPQRSKANDWRRFIESHWPHLAALDFATVEVSHGSRTRRHHVLYAIRVITMEVRVIGVTDQANGTCMLNIVRSLTDPDSGFLMGTQVVLMDRDPLFTAEVRACCARVGCLPQVLPPRSTNINAYIERFIGTMRREVGRRIISLSGDHLESVLRGHITYYNHEWNHQGLASHSIPMPLHDRHVSGRGPVKCRSRQGKTLNFYYREAV